MFRNHIFGRVCAPRGEAPCCEGLEQRLLLSASVSGVAWTDFDGDGIRDMGDTPLKSLVIFSDDNANGLLDQSMQTANSYMMRTMDGGNVISDFITVASAYRKIVDVNVRVNLGAMSTQSLSLYLQGPSGRRVMLAQGVGAGMRGGFRNVIFDDQAPNSVSLITSAPGGTFSPQGLLSILNGDDPNGTWTLEVRDSSADTSATVLYSWGLTFTFGEVSTVTAADGTYSLKNIDAGARHIRQKAQLNWSPTLPAGGVYNVTLADGQNVSGMDFAAYPTPGQIRGSKWLDSNGNGVRDVGEVGLAGWTIYIDANENYRLDAGETSTVTDANGDYVLTNVPIGQYAIAEVEQPGWIRTRPGGAADRLFVLGGDGTVRELNADFGVVRMFRPPEIVSAMAVGNKSLFVMSSSGVLWELNPDTGAAIDRDVPAGLASGAEIAFLNNRLYISNPSDGSIIVWNPDTDAVEATLAVNREFWGLTGAADRGVLYGGTGGEVMAIDPSTGAMLGHFDIATAPAGGMAWQNGKLIVAPTATTLARLDPDTGLVEGTAALNLGVSSVTALGGDGAVNRFVTLQAGGTVSGVDFGGQPVTPAPTLVDLADASDTGMSAIDNVTRRNNALEITISGTVAGATVWLYLDGTTLIASAVATSDTVTFTTDASLVLADGQHTFAARQQAPMEAMSAFAPGLSVTIITVAPPAPDAPDLQALSDSGASANDNVTNVSTPTFDLSQTPYFRMYRDGVLISAPGAAGLTFTDGPLADGTYTYTMIAEDLAGNESVSSAGITVTIDTAAPAITQFLAQGGSVRDSQNVFIMIQLSEDLSASSLAGMLQMQGSGGRLVDLSAAVFQYDPLTRTCVWNLNAVPLTNGNYTVRLLTGGVSDLAGNMLNGGVDYVTTVSGMNKSITKGHKVTSAATISPKGVFDLLASSNRLA